MTKRIMTTNGEIVIMLHRQVDYTLEEVGKIPASWLPKKPRKHPYTRQDGSIVVGLSSAMSNPLSCGGGRRRRPALCGNCSSVLTHGMECDLCGGGQSESRAA